MHINIHNAVRAAAKAVCRAATTIKATVAPALSGVYTINIDGVTVKVTGYGDKIRVRLTDCDGALRPVVATVEVDQLTPWLQKWIPAATKTLHPRWNGECSYGSVYTGRGTYIHMFGQGDTAPMEMHISQMADKIIRHAGLLEVRTEGGEA